MNTQLLFISLLLLLSAIPAHLMSSTEPEIAATETTIQDLDSETSPGSPEIVPSETTPNEEGETETNPGIPATDPSQTTQEGEGAEDTSPGTQPTDPTGTEEAEEVTSPEVGATDAPATGTTIETTGGEEATNPDAVTGTTAAVTDDGETGGTSPPDEETTSTTTITFTTPEPTPTPSPSTIPPALDDKTLDMELEIKINATYDVGEREDWMLEILKEVRSVYIEDGDSYGFQSVEVTDIRVGSVIGDYTVRFKLDFILANGITSYNITQDYIIGKVLPKLGNAEINGAQVDAEHIDDVVTKMVNEQGESFDNKIGEPCENVFGLCAHGYKCTKPSTNIVCTAVCLDAPCDANAKCFTELKKDAINEYDVYCRCNNKYIPFPGDSCVEEGLVIGLSVGIGGAVIIGLIIALIVVSKTKKSIPQLKYVEVDKSKGVISDDGKDEEIELGVESTTLTGLQRHDSNLSEVPEPYTGKNGHINNAYMENGPHYHDIPANQVTSKPDEVSEPDVVPQSTFKPRKPEPEPPRNDTYKSRIDRYSDYRSPDRYTDDRKNDRYPYDNRDNRDNGRYETDIDDDPVIRNFEPQLQNVDHSRPIHIKRPKINLTPMDNNSRSPSSAHTSARQSYNDEPPYGYHRSFDGRY